MKRKFVIFLILTFICFFSTYFIHSTTSDEIWNFGFSYNIAKGAIPYRDFNMVILPLYSLLFAIPLKLFANKLFVFHLFNAVFSSFILVFINKNNNIFSVIYLFLLVNLVPVIYGYNYFIMLLLILVLYIEANNYKYKNEIIGLLLGCILATKQNVGLALFIPYIINSKNKLKSLAYFCFPSILVLVYLLINNALFQCIDYCFLGLKNFKNNLYKPQSIYLCIIFIIFEFLLINYLLIKYKKSKDINYIYLLVFQVLVYPIFDSYHILISLIPIFYYVSSKIDNKKYYILLSIIIAICYFNNEYKIYLSNLNNFEYRNLGSSIVDKNIEKEIDFFEKNNKKRIFIFTDGAYILKIAMNKEINKFDLINTGNMGADEKNYINEIEKICKNKNCIFIANKVPVGQLSPTIINYVNKNYNNCGEITVNHYYFCSKKGK